MASLDSVSIAILLGAALVMAGILSSLLALRFGAPLVLVFLFIGMLAGDSGPGQLRFDDVRTTYLVGSVALAVILFDGGLRTGFQSIRAVLAPSMVLATIGVLLTALITAPVAKYALDLNWTEALLVGAVVASTDAAAVFLLVHAQGLRLRPRVGATLEVESGTNDPFAVFLTLMLVELISVGDSSLWHVAMEFAREAVLGAIIGGVGLRGAVAIFLASIPLLVGLSKAYLYFDVAFVVVIISLLLQGWTLAAAARRLHVALPRSDRGPRRIELDLPGQLEQQLVGYSVRPKSLYLRRGLIPSWSKPTLVIRDEKILSPVEADPVTAGDYIYLLAPPEKAEALDRFFVDMPPSSAPDPHLLGDFTVSGEVTLGDIAAAYGTTVDTEQAKLTLADYFDIHLDHAPKEGATLALDSIVLVARSIGGGRVNIVGLRLPEEEEASEPPTRMRKYRRKLAELWSSVAGV